MRIDWYLVWRSIKHFAQRRYRGFDDRETWSLDHTTAMILLPRLKAFRKNHYSYPPDLTPEECIDKIEEGVTNIS